MATAVPTQDATQPVAAPSLCIASFDVGSRNLSLCITQNVGWGQGVEQLQSEITYWSLNDILTEHDPKLEDTKKKVSVELATLCMVEYLERHRELLLTADLLAIESQPAMRISNIKTKVLSHVIQAWFAQAKPTAPIQFCSGKRKLKGVPGMDEADQ